MDLGILDYDFMFDNIERMPQIDLPESPQTQSDYDLLESIGFPRRCRYARRQRRRAPRHSHHHQVAVLRLPVRRRSSTWGRRRMLSARRLDSWRSDLEQRLFDGVLPDENLLLRRLWEWEGRRMDEIAQRKLGSLMRAIDEDLRKLRERWHASTDLEAIIYSYLYGLDKTTKYRNLQSSDLQERCDIIVRFTGPDSSKGRKPHQGRWNWKEKSMKGLRAVADPSPQTPVPGQQQQQPHQGYVRLKKALELDDDGSGNKWRAHEYTPLLQPDEDPSKLVPADISLRFVYKVDEPPSSHSSKRPRPGEDGPSNGPRVSDVWGHMTKVHVKVATDDNDNADGSSKRKKNPYKLMYAICNHCDKVFNADPKNGTNNQSKHLANCKCDCPHSH